MINKFNIHKKQPWQLPEKLVTPESIWQNRRQFMKTAGAGTIAGALGGSLLPSLAQANNSAWVKATRSLYPAKSTTTYDKAKKYPLTSEKDATTYNNFYEFGSDKTIARWTKDFTPYPWTITVDGQVDKPIKMDILPLIKKFGLETRIYRHRCVETWSMVVPWVGFPLNKLLKHAGVDLGAKYVEMFTLDDAEVFPGMSAKWYPWPYNEGLTMAEAMHDLSFMVVGMYDKPIPNQNGAPLRIALPWKYGFKSVKSIVRIHVTNKKPLGFWEKIARDEYGFYANVNPAVSHPRWSQQQEKLLGTKKKIPTLKYNGYGEWVEPLYKDLPQDRSLFY